MGATAEPFQHTAGGLSEDNEHELAAEKLPLAQQRRFKYPGLLGFLGVLLVSFVDATIGLIRQSRRRSPGVLR